MNAIQALSHKQVGALLLPRHKARDMLVLAADLALHAPLRVVDGGNLFNALLLSRMIRRKTSHVIQTMNRIYISRAFTCYQMEAMLAELTTPGSPLLVMDLLSTFYDESVSDEQSQRLLHNCLAHLKRASGVVPVLVSVSPPRQAGKRLFLLETLLEGIDHVWQWEAEEKPPQQPTLWE